MVRWQDSKVVPLVTEVHHASYGHAAVESEAGEMCRQRTATSNKRVPPALTPFAPENTARPQRAASVLLNVI